MKPITPNEVIEHKSTIIPDFIIEIFNDLIAKNFSNGSSKIYLEEVNKELYSRKKFSSDKAFKEKWFDVEDIYREAGWKVNYDQPGYNENYEAFYTFKK